MHNRTYSRRSFAVIGLLLLILGTACGRTEQPNEQRIAELLEKGVQMLSAAALEAEGGYGPLFLYDTEWHHEDDVSRIDVERFPEWAGTEYEICVYWEGTYSTKEINFNRTPGNSAMHFDLFGTAWGWILVGDNDVYFLELSFGYDEEDEGDITVVIDAWDQPE